MKIDRGRNYSRIVCGVGRDINKIPVSRKVSSPMNGMVNRSGFILASTKEDLKEIAGKNLKWEQLEGYKKRKLFTDAEAINLFNQSQNQ